MTQPKQHRWRCPKCGGGLLAPSRPRGDDVRRYCLPCSQKTGRLVRRVCAALEHKREASRERSAAKQKRHRARAARRRDEREAFDQDRRVVAGVDIEKFAARCWRHIRSSARCRPSTCQRPPALSVRRSPTKSCSAHAYPWEHRATFTFGDKATRANVECTVLHELCHCAAPDEETADGRDAQHGDSYNWLLLDVAKRLWGARYDVGPGVAKRGYGPSRWLEKTRAKQLCAEQDISA